MSNIGDVFCKQVGIELPIICGAMYPCSNPELVAAASEAGGIGIIQPLSLVYVNKLEFRKGLQLIRSLTKKPIGMNAIVEKSHKKYNEAMQNWIDIALEEGVRFFVTSLGNPGWVVRKAEQVGGIVYHDVTEAKFAQKAMQEGVHGLIAVNNRAGGHAGRLSSQQLIHDLAPMGVPVIAAGGVGTASEFVEMMRAGYAGVQMGTRFIATSECKAHEDYKKAIVDAAASDIVLTDKISGIPVSVILNDYVRAVGTKSGPLVKMLLKHHKFKHWVRQFYSLKSVWKLKRDERRGGGYGVYWQAGKSVDGIHEILPTAAVMQSFREAYKQH
jgi:nitronate monooxygenase